MKTIIIKRAVATAVAVALSLFTVAVYAGTNNADEGSGYDVSFDFDFTEYDRTEETVYTIDIINMIEQPTATPSDATPSDAIEEPVKPIDGGYSGSDNQEAAEDKITALPANIESGKVGAIEAHYNRPQPEIPVIPIEPDTPDGNGEEHSGGSLRFPKTGDNSHPKATVLLFFVSLTVIICHFVNIDYNNKRRRK